MRCLLDTNVVLDVLLTRAPFEDEATQVWTALTDGRIACYITASALTDIFYIARKQTDKNQAHKALQTCLDTLEICTVDRQAIERALSLSGSDFEDNLQEACALTYGLDAIVTRDKEGFKSSNVLAMTPLELLAQLDVSS